MTCCNRCGRRVTCKCELDRRLTPHADAIIAQLCAELKLSVAQFHGHTRPQHVVTKRQIVHYLLSVITGEKYVVIAKWARRDHSTITHSVSMVMNRMNREFEFARMVARLETICREGDQSRAA